MTVKLKQKIFFSTFISSCCYVVIYLIYSFTTWTIRNPLQWIIDIPTYENHERFGIFFGLFFYWLFVILISHNVIEDMHTKKEHE